MPSKVSYLPASGIADIWCNDPHFSRDAQARLVKLGIPVKYVEITRTTESRKLKAHETILVTAYILKLSVNEPESIKTELCFSPLVTMDGAKYGFEHMIKSLKESYDNHIKNQ